ncbi:MAG: acyl-CoA thioesterase [Planctomycetes bacterium]|nr:acyl-CoA thioesterase [Planctomycetota bacterium]MCB9909712.1 acyl-CoA thioesterase [Planctomycetota bacterium]MCB9911799.1 acyl-CoA thioesterase [Planctomycetota bacterium]HPF15165.1 thioesterase family protein [Planctomycetota bacterium]HRV79912.1 thioesterase family protein [Planctomycetota bacterium]
MKPYETQVLVRFGDVDAAGIAYFPSIYNLIHDTFEDLWYNHLGVSYADLIMKQRLGFPLVRSEVDFRKVLRFGDRPTIQVTCEGVGRSSLHLRYRFFLGEDLALDAHMTTACVDMDHLKSCPIPEAYRKVFLALMEEGSQPHA